MEATQTTEVRRQSKLDVHAAPKAHYPWLCERVGYSPTPCFRAIEAVDSSGTIRAMVGFDLFTDNSAQMSVAMDAPVALRAIIYPAFDYLFCQLNKGVALAIVSSANARALKLDAHLGFREVYRVRDGLSVGTDLVVLEMRREECRWLKGTHA